MGALDQACWYTPSRSKGGVMSSLRCSNRPGTSAACFICDESTSERQTKNNTPPMALPVLLCTTYHRSVAYSLSVDHLDSCTQRMWTGLPASRSISSQARVSAYLDALSPPQFQVTNRSPFTFGACLLGWGVAGPTYLRERP